MEDRKSTSVGPTFFRSLLYRCIMAARRLTGLLKTLGPIISPTKCSARSLNTLVSEHTVKWMQREARESSRDFCWLSPYSSHIGLMLCTAEGQRLLSKGSQHPVKAVQIYVEHRELLSRFSGHCLEAFQTIPSCLLAVQQNSGARVVVQLTKISSCGPKNQPSLLSRFLDRRHMLS
ncbi:uncharacterized protein LOC110109305 isoform X1 [Dendrobium catenatum]|uniref:uncharacterized protein LOC110109305 isoform X1 n=1 Tax=Dendrobium catenatum TaxID=906689 RepID=UPI0010A07CE5|nr:uncharacterized protein LOC110109305 isoform X1 [Dendrobium catenatum]